MKRVCKHVESFVSRMLAAMLFCLGVVCSSYAQENETRMYLVDMTASMVGVADPNVAATDIWNVVKGNLKASIECIDNNPRNTITIVPFADNIKTAKILTQPATTKGKQILIDYIEAIDKGNGTVKNGMVGDFYYTTTNIVEALEYFYKNQRRDNINIMYLYTDGQNSKKHGGADKLIKTINKWTAETQNSVAKSFGIYVFLTGVAVDENVREAIKKQVGFEVTSGLQGVSHYRMQDHIVYNLKEDKSKNLKMEGPKCGGNVDGKIWIEGENDYCRIRCDKQPLSGCEINFSLTKKAGNTPEKFDLYANVYKEGLDGYTFLVTEKVRITVMNKEIRSVDITIK